MMNAIRYTILSSTLSLFLSVPAIAQLKEVNVNTSEVQTLRVDPLSANGGNAADIFEEIKYIPLETTPESHFAQIGQLILIHGRYVILDPSTNCILIFTEQGKFIAKIKGKKDLPILKFQVNRWRHEIVFSNDFFETLSFYSLDGTFIRTQENNDPKNTGVLNFWFDYIAANTVLSYDTYRDTKPDSKFYRPYSRSLVRYAKEDGAVTATGFPYSEAEASIDASYTPMAPLFYTGNDTTRFFAKPYTYDIYTISPNAIVQNYHMVFPASMSWPNDFLTNNQLYSKRIKFTQTHPNIIAELSYVYKVKDNLVFRLWLMEHGKENFLMLNLVSGNLIAYQHISPDISSYYLPLYDENEFIHFGLNYCDGTHIYTWLTSHSMFDAYKNNQEKHIKYNDELSAYFSKSGKDDNPVIVRLKLKNEL
ncbi:6-bladed beta-propeller [Chitinophaga sp. Cy-1792]|uniref:6-bladed beta-propeller n=1 Tax=Chitinophaga sp. Cy-1792 TaxID=2608339 RepID=UPI0014214105|nr:6-bladed beta-propeller [Chitinophaga sp. Cy-1792]